MSNGTVKECGIGLPLGRTQTSSRTPVEVPEMSDIVQITGGANAFGALDRDGNVYTWGMNNNGQVGVGSSAPVIGLPTKVSLPAAAVEISSGGDVASNGHVLALLDNGQVYGWGTDTNGQLGDGLTVDEFRPVRVTLPTGVTFTKVVAAGCSSLALDSTGGVWAWGCGAQGELGTSANVSFPHPVEVDAGVEAVSATADDVMDLHPPSETSPRPEITVVEPATRTASAVTRVKIVGNFLSGASAVRFGTSPAPAFTVSADGTSITAEVPAGLLGSVDVIVVTPGGISPVTPSDEFAGNRPLSVLTKSLTQTSPLSSVPRR